LVRNDADRNLIDVLLDVGQRITAFYGERSRGDLKEPGELVTAVDTEADRLLVEAIRSLYPDHGVFSEESGGSAASTRRWIVDPLDGTTNLLFGVPHFGISLAREVDGVVVQGLVYNPMTEELFYADVESRGAYLNGQKIHVSQTAKREEALVALGFSATYRNIRRYYEEWPAAFDSTRKAVGLLAPALNLCNVAAGRIDAFIDFGSSVEGHAAAAFLVERAGGLVMNYDRSRWDHRSRGVVATNGALSDLHA
jgi:fructose-1,6-bisphosphatase/inositol monophosphatase family enzyme